MPRTFNRKAGRPYFYALILLTFVQAGILQQIIELYFGQEDGRIPLLSSLSLVVTAIILVLYRIWNKKENSKA
ncbi:hypothetical protein PP175_13245 [Aneurinibacillus sp. Ricciae_BoGa-3]|uniref:hypothetical protein n=1 Tax=Aneurinibacillus sp. Ricciae_BoGa-3 TaxID=3022697 RepID=UPI0023408AC7|nr:hypothetical protein [Aneurinibacillus sp. Ricciae_BoGa-3]WCK52424.1 hypothetical protein PP175_13245 [Aneurinibacillus sp. Ricciae_BoGa-3]